MERYLFALALGAVSLLVLPYLPSLSYLGLACLLCLLLAIKWRVWLLPALLLLSMMWCVWQAQYALSLQVPRYLEDKPFKVQVKIEGLPDYTPYGLRIRVKPIKVISRIDYPLSDNMRWQLSTSQKLNLRPEQIWQMTVSLRRPHGTSSAGAFDYQAWLLAEGVSATGKVTRAQLVKSAGWSVDEWRLQIREKFQQNLAQYPQYGVVLALLTGDRALVPDANWDLYAATGVSHLMAISGPHVMLSALAITWLWAKLLAFWPSIFLRIPLQQLKLPVTLLVAVCYGLLAGLSVPTLRTLLVVAMLLLLTGFRKEIPASRVLLLAFVLIVLWQPLNVHLVSFWLSFGAVALLMLWSGMTSIDHKIKQFVRLQCWITIALLPLTLGFFGLLSWVAPLANIVAIPIVGGLIVPIALVGLGVGLLSTTLQSVCWTSAIHILQGLNSYLSYLAQIPYGKQIWVLSASHLLFLSVALALWLLPKGLLPRLLTPLLLLPVIFKWPAVPKGEAQLSVIDVGQGLSILIQTQHHALLYDTGANQNAGERIINRYLYWRNVKQLDGLMISHNDKDHTGGANALVQQFVPQQAWYSAAPEGYQLSSTTKQQLCVAGQHWQWDDVNFEVLSPVSGAHYDKDNNRSCVLRVSSQGFSVLLTGDMETPAENILLQQGINLQSDMLILGHHGSKTSSSETFLQAVRPKLAIVSAGYHNQFAHPSPVVIARLQQRQLAIDSTIQHGTLRYLLGKEGIIKREAWRERGHYWLNVP
ncbi:MAG: DNA internalization-related competence protein ComEC/Rec2 [Agitococcus sp.]